MSYLIRLEHCSVYYIKTYTAGLITNIDKSITRPVRMIYDI